MGFMVVRAEETKKIFLDEIAVLLIENPAVSLTGCLLEALLVNVLNETVTINQTKQTVLNVIKYCCRSFFEALNEGDLSVIQFYSL